MWLIALFGVTKWRPGWEKGLCRTAAHLFQRVVLRLYKIGLSCAERLWFKRWLAGSPCASVSDSGLCGGVCVNSTSFSDFECFHCTLLVTYVLLFFLIFIQAKLCANLLSPRTMLYLNLRRYFNYSLTIKTWHRLDIFNTRTPLWFAPNSQLAQQLQTRCHMVGV